MSNTERTQWIWELVDKSDASFAKLDTKFDKVERKVDLLDKKDSFSAMKKSSSGLQRNLRDLRTEVPLLDRGLNLLSNPLVAASAAGFGLFTILRKSEQAAARFNNQFLELENLNLSKTEAQIDRLRDKVLRTSFNTGIDASKTSTAFFDVQSATGKYGLEVEQIVSKLAKFSTATKADFTNSIEGASKSIGIFNLKGKDLDRFLESSAKTVQVGITTFDQLAKVQVEYAGAAAAANQGFNEGNKVFALFSKNAKSVDIAATLTKTAFQDLTKKRTIEGFKSIGVNLFDAKGEMMQIDSIASQLVPKLSSMSDSDFAKFKESVGGSEGIKSLLDQLKVSGEGVLQTFNDFDKAEFNIDDAFANAVKDAQTLSSILDNKLNTSLTAMGQKLTPISNEFKKFGLYLLDQTNFTMKGLNAMLNTDGHKQDTEAFYSNKFQDAAMAAFENKGVQDKFNKMSPSSQADFIKKLEAQKKQYNESLNSGKFAFGSKEQGILSGKIGTVDSILSILNNKQDLAVDTDKKTGKTSGASVTGIQSSGSNRNVTVNIDKLVENLQFVNEAEQGAELNVEEKITELLIRAVRDAENVISN